MKIQKLCSYFIGISLILGWGINAWGIKAVIVSLEAPLFQKKNVNSVIVQYKRKGEVIILHEKDFGLAPYEGDYQNQEFYEKEEDLLPLILSRNLRPASDSYRLPQVNWYTTLDRNGQIAYIQKKHLRFIMGDTREQAQNPPFSSVDPTDYRLEEPLPDHYPFFYHERYRGFFGISVNPAPKVNYPYPQAIVGQHFSNHFGLTGAYTRHLNGDRHNRFYGGIYWLIAAGQQEFTLEKGTSAQEVSFQVAAGPYFSYDFFRRKEWRFTIYGGILYNYQQQTVNQTNSLQEEQRIFGNFFLSTISGTMLVMTSPLPKTEFYLSSSFELYPPHSLSTSDPSEIPGLWKAQSTEDKISYGPGGTISLGLGLVANY